MLPLVSLQFSEEPLHCTLCQSVCQSGQALAESRAAVTADFRFACVIEVCHEKTNLKVFVVVILKEGWARMAAPILLLV